MVGTAMSGHAEGVDGPAVHAAMLSAAAVRADEDDSACPLFTDPFVQPLLSAAAAHGWHPERHLDGIAPAAFEAYVACRTRWFDQHFVTAGAHGVDQAVILASGLDTRAWRLPWLSSSTVYELDRPSVLDFKCAVLDQHNAARATNRHVVVPTDPRTDWSTPLLQAGFDPTEPVAWSLEGMLPAWSAGDRAAAVHRAVELSRPGSRLAAELPEDEAGALGDWLAELGWQVSTVSAHTLLDRYARCRPDDADEALPRRIFLDAALL